VGFGSAAYPNNFGIVTFGEVEFPVMPSGVKSCAKCHGTDSTAWIEPSDRSHPTAQILPARNWTPVCGSCHDADDAQAHISIMTSSDGAEACGVCHGPDGEMKVQSVHKVY
jgi:cytochrome c553